MERTFLITSTQLQDVMRYLMSRPYAEVVKLMNMLAGLEPLDPRIGKDFVKQQKGESENDERKETTKRS